MQSNMLRTGRKLSVRITARALVLAAMIASCDLVSTLRAVDWPQWQGPNRNAMSNEQGLLKEWPAGGPSLVRKIPGLGGGDSAPSIAGGRIFGMGNRSGNEVVWALSESNGHELWGMPL